MKLKTILLILLLTLLLASCGMADLEAPQAGQPNEPDAAPDENTETAPEPQTLTVMTHDSFAISDEVLAAFESEHNATVEFIRSGDTGSAVNAAVLAAGAPFADVFYGVDNTFLSRALGEGIFEAYASPLLAEIPDEFKIDPGNFASPVDFGDVCLNLDLAYFADNGLAAPESLEDLLKPEYAGLTAVTNPASSSPGLAFLFATIGHFGEEGYLDFWQALVDNDLKVVNDWETVYYTEFSRWGGGRPIVVSYGSSPPFEVIFAEEPMDTPPTAALITSGACFRQIEFVGILKGTEQRPLAEAWVDFMLSTAFQEDLPLQNYVFPVNQTAQLDPVFEEFLFVPDEPVILDPADIAERREEWISAWRAVVLQ